ncbi:MAG TPA: DUF4132 domain-containing protein [Ktedonobacterales bacterium]|jgi:Domain of unknown function (DUF4132)|nr:DUF4132 domain-containing protein [Ktedonobacterales bacterium]
MSTPLEREAYTLLQAYKDESTSQGLTWGVKPSNLAAGRAILAADPESQVAIIRAALINPPRSWRAMDLLLSQLARRNLPYATDDVCAILAEISKATSYYYMPIQALLRALARPLSDPATLEACRADLIVVRTAINGWYSSAEQRKMLRLVDELLGGQPEPPVVYSDEWGDQVRPLLDEMDADVRERWVALLRQCAASKGSAPTTKWVAATQRLLDALGKETFARLAIAWLSAFRKSGNKPPERDSETYDLVSNGCLLVEENGDLLRGLAWACAGIEDTSLAAVLADTAIAGYRKITGVGPRSAKVAGACVYALKSMPGLHGAAQLERVRLGVKQPTYLKGIERSLDEAAERVGMTRDDLEELTVPTFDLQQDKREIPFGALTAEIRIDGLEVEIAWRDAQGKPRKAETAEVKREYKAELKDLKRLRDDIARMLAAQRDRIERLPLLERSWSLGDWRARYLDHPLIGGLARRLIWRFRDGDKIMDGAWHDEVLVDAHDHPLNLPESARVSLWHPVYSNASATLAWRNWLERLEITQPFKQAHREVYLLTDAERATRVYSNRFAGHILRQHQFNALAAGRGWRNKLRLMVDDEYPPASLDLPHCGLRAEYWIEGAGDDYGTDTNETGTYLYLTTDQVRFYRLNAQENHAHATGGGYRRWHFDDTGNGPNDNTPIPLEQIPPLVLSEVLRDVDLFVGVASVGNDPTWQDGGPAGRYRDYWRSYSFGELSATAETRKQLLARLIPRLAIADRCAVEGRFLRVRGDLRTYKIHLGSGNILMEPNDQYLCIVPSRGGGETATGNLYLPFAGDSVFSIILSKAFLLAEDTKIKDTTITRQLAMR